MTEMAESDAGRKVKERLYLHDWVKGCAVSHAPSTWMTLGESCVTCEMGMVNFRRFSLTEASDRFNTGPIFTVTVVTAAIITEREKKAGEAEAWGGGETVIFVKAFWRGHESWVSLRNQGTVC